MLTIRPGGAQLIIPGIQIIQAGGGDVPWWLAAGITPICAYAAKGAADLASSYVNLANPGTYDTTTSSSPTWDATNGWVLASAGAQFLDTGIVPVAGMSAIIRFSNVGNEDSYLFGESSGGSGGGADFALIPNLASATNRVRYGYGDNTAVKVPNLASGILAIAGNKAYRNGVDEGLTVGAWTGTTLFGISIGRLNRASPAGYIDANVQAFALFSSILDAAQNLAMYTAMAAL